jgi:phosphoenolpyruvate carboxykinase (GTP)
MIHSTFKKFVNDFVSKMKPNKIHLCDGSTNEYNSLINKMVQTGTLIKLNENLRPNSYLARSTVSDVARIEEKTFICSTNKNDAGYTNNWYNPQEMKSKLLSLFENCMKGRTMYIIPYCMGLIDSPYSKLGVQITDSPYVVCNMHIMTKINNQVLQRINNGEEFIQCVHSLGQPLEEGQQDSTWPSNDEKYIVHFPQYKQIFSYGSGYGGNALLGKKCFALRIASVMGKEEGWLAEHMLIVGVTNPEGVKKYFLGAFPSGCGKTNFAMMTPSLPGWKIEMIGDDIAWIRVGKDGRMYAINPENGIFGVCPGTSYKTNKVAMETLKDNTLFTNVALTEDNDVWWESSDSQDIPEKCIDWLRREHYKDDKTLAAHPNSRYTARISQCPILDQNYYSNEGVPISGIIFGGRRSTTIPLVYESKSWNHGVFIGATLTSETTATAVGKCGVVRNDPFAMRPFCGYNMAHYFSHWSSFSELQNKPKIFGMNLFKKNSEGKFLWKGFGENIRILKWMFERCDQNNTENNSIETSIGFLPKKSSLHLSNLEISDQTLEELLKIDKNEWKQEIENNKEFLNNFKEDLPEFIKNELYKLEKSFN